MSLLTTTITNLRNLSAVTLAPCPGVNLIAGENGSGKTSILEAFHLLGYGRSFRSHRIEPIITHGQTSLTIFSKVLGKHGEILAVGIEKHREGGSTIRVGGVDAQSAAELARIIPIQLINADSYRLLEAGPKYRRQFLDWGVFHVEHSFFPAWQRLQRALKQRNAALRGKGHAIIHAWDEEIINLTQLMTELRQRYLQQFLPLFNRIAAEFLPGRELALNYFPGWNCKQDYREALAASLPRDRELGYTQLGPHRADVRIVTGGQPVERILSRGQQKMLFNALQLTHGLLLKEQVDKSCVYLVDDLPAELDNRAKQCLIALLAELNSQAFITGIDKAELSALFANKPAKMFHVEHGVVKAA